MSHLVGDGGATLFLERDKFCPLKSSPITDEIQIKRSHFPGGKNVGRLSLQIMYFSTASSWDSTCMKFKGDKFIY